MFLIYILLLAVSVVFGSRSKNKVLGQVQYPCPACKRKSYHSLVRNQRWFTLYFLPVVPMGRTTTSRCNICGYQQSLSGKEAETLLAGGSIAPPVPR